MKEPIEIRGFIHRVVVDKDGASKLTFEIPQEDAAKVALLVGLTQVEFAISLEELEAKTHGRKAAGS